MEVSMDTSPGLPHPQPQQTLSTSTSPVPAPASATAAPGSPSPSPSSRKRSLQDPNGDNQENDEPSTTGRDSVEMEDADKPAAASTTTTEEPPAEPKRMVRVEIPLSTIPTPNTNAEQVPPPPSTPQHSTSTTNVPAAKKRKLSPSSKEAKQQEKEAKERQRAEEKVKKEEEKAKKEEEKAKKEEEKKAKEEEKKKKEVEREEEKKKRDAEKEEKKRVKDEERAVKEEEKRKREEEKSKKERAQTKLNAFFAKPKASVESSNPGPSGSPKKNASDGAAANEGTSDVVSDYKRVFPDFFLQSHTKVAPPHRFERDSEALEVMRQRMDESLKSDPQEPLVFRPSELFRMMPYKRRRGRQAASVKDILLQIQNMGSNGDGPSTAAATTTAVANPGHRPQDQLKKIRMKSLKFGEDVRPPYQGTYTKKVPESCAYKLSRNPYRRELPDTSYDYDSEAEWEEPEEGEELDSEEEEEGSEDGDDDMEGFLDDEEDQPAVDGKRRLIVGDLEPQSTGLRWQETEAVDNELQMYQIQTISDSVTFPIDPFSTVYWQKPKPDATPGSNGAPTPGGSNSNNATAEGSNGGHGNALTLLGSGTGKTKGRPFPPEQLAEFKGMVDGSDLTKMGLVEILKKKFPKVSKEVLKETLNRVATRVGSKEADKKWVCK